MSFLVIERHLDLADVMIGKMDIALKRLEKAWLCDFIEIWKASRDFRYYDAVCKRLIEEVREFRAERLVWFEKHGVKI